MSIFGVLVWAAVVAWLVLTIFVQFPSISAKLSRFDAFRLIPVWTFFAPNPGVVDYHFVVRDRCNDGSITSWVALKIAAERHVTNCIWNPQKRPKKILLDSVQSLIVISTSDPERAGQELISLPYLLLLHFATTAPWISFNSWERQFAIIQSSGHANKKLEPAYISEFHKLQA